MAARLLRQISRHLSSPSRRHMHHIHDHCHGPFMNMPTHPTKCQATYIWVSGTGDLCSRGKTLDHVPTKMEDYPPLTYAWQSTEGVICDYYLKPVADYPDPFLGGTSRLTLCETFDQDMKPATNNYRHECKRIMDQVADEEPWFGIEQEYLLVDKDHMPLGWPKQGFPVFNPRYYCGVGADRSFGREIVEAHYRACLHIGLSISGINAEVTPSQWEFQIGPTDGVTLGDELWMARYILHRITEAYDVIACFDPRPETTGIWSGAGCHTNFSTKKTRGPGGLSELQRLVPKLGESHVADLECYDPNGGKDNVRRLKSMFSNDEFSWGIGDRTASVRIPAHCAVEGKGYFEDRRPASNCDPYLVASTIVSATLLS